MVDEALINTPGIRSSEIVEAYKQGKDYISINDIVNVYESREEGDGAMRKFYKAKVYTQSEKIDSNRSISLNQSEVTGCSFVRVKVSEQNYFG